MLLPQFLQPQSWLHSQSGLQRQHEPSRTQTRVAHGNSSNFSLIHAIVARG